MGVSSCSFQELLPANCCNIVGFSSKYQESFRCNFLGLSVGVNLPKHIVDSEFHVLLDILPPLRVSGSDRERERETASSSSSSSSSSLFLSSCSSSFCSCSSSSSSFFFFSSSSSSSSSPSVTTRCQQRPRITPTWRRSRTHWNSTSSWSTQPSSDSLTRNVRGKGPRDGSVVNSTHDIQLRTVLGMECHCVQ